jgi:hypothetical protein
MPQQTTDRLGVIASRRDSGQPFLNRVLTTEVEDEGHAAVVRIRGVEKRLKDQWAETSAVRRVIFSSP